MPMNISSHFPPWREMTPVCCQGRWEDRELHHSDAVPTLPRRKVQRTGSRKAIQTFSGMGFLILQVGVLSERTI